MRSRRKIFLLLSVISLPVIAVQPLVFASMIKCDYQQCLPCINEQQCSQDPFFEVHSPFRPAPEFAGTFYYMSTVYFDKPTYGNFTSANATYSGQLKNGRFAGLILSTKYNLVDFENTIALNSHFRHNSGFPSNYICQGSPEECRVYRP